MTLRTLLAGLVILAAAPALAQEPQPTDANLFAAEMERAMGRMDEEMMAVKRAGNPDRDFAAMMIPHHQGAIDMALIELRFGHDQRLRRLAQGIIVEQQQEIALMQQLLAEIPAPIPQSLMPGTTGHTHMEPTK